ncbi:MAG: GNAT family N-acetyltransferase [Paludibacter sp.]|nr:GNAT family N-acetyltransferase [Paludibacter sp.]
MVVCSNDITRIDVSQWSDLIRENDTATFFQTPECYHFYASLSFLKPFVYAVSENDKLVGVMCGYIIADGNVVKQFFSRRAIVPGGLLLHTGISTSALKSLLNEATTQLKSKAIYLEIRNYNDYSVFRPIIETTGFVYNAHLNFHIATPDVESALKKLNVTKRRDVKLSRNEGADWIETKDPDDVNEYYEILHDLYLTKVKTPLFPREFFEKLVQLDNGKLFVIKYKNKVIGGSVCVALPGIALYEWFVCGLDGQIKNVFPSTIATYAAIEYAAGNGFQRFDMMGAGKPDEAYGVREFKSKFGGELLEQGRFLYVLKPRLFKLGKWMVKKMKG